jgi:hypothetical protein
MNKFKFYFISIITTVVLFSCAKEDTATDYTPVPLRDYETQFKADNATIEDYLKANYIKDLDKPDMLDGDIVITAITDVADSNQKSIFSYLNATTFPKLLSRPVAIHGITYKLYYLVLREGTVTSPMNTDAVLTAYSAQYLSTTVGTTAVPSTVTATVSETVRNPQSFFDLLSLIRGWKEVFPQFKTGSAVSNSDGTISYKDFGAGVMFLPSGLGYFNTGKGTIPAYAPLVFTFKMYAMKRLDHEYFASGQNFIASPDGISDYQEDKNNDGYVWTKDELQVGSTDNPDDTDKDGIPDFLDLDDDGDGYSTKLEISKSTNPLDKNSFPK